MPAKHALIVGVDKYCNLDKKYELSGCVNDALLIKSVLIDHFNFAEDSITELHNEAASREKILAEMNGLVDKVGKDDIVIFHFSGHGSRRTAASLEEASGKDSTIMPYDSGRDPLPNLDIIDDEIHEWLGRLSKKTRYITLTFDCCHSGTITRDAFGATVRAVEDDNRTLEGMGVDRRTLPAPSKSATRDVGPGGWLALSDSYVVMSGCRDNEYSHEFTQEDGGETIRNGALTHFLVNALVRAKPGTTYRDVFELARQGVNSRFPTQNPQIEGAQDREIFGVKDIEPMRFISVASVTGDQVTLGGGAAHGLHSKSTWAVYPQGTKQIAGSKPIGQIEVLSVGPLMAEGVIQATSGDIGPGARCVEKEPSETQFQLKIDVSALPKKSASEILAGVDKSALLTNTEMAESADIRAYLLEPRDEATGICHVPQIDKIETPTWAFVDREGALAMPLHATSEKNVVTTLMDNLEAISRYRNALKLDMSDSDLDVEFNIYRRTERDELEKANGGDSVFHDGDYLAFEVVNNEKNPVFVSVLDFGVTGKISLLYPPNKTSEMIEAGQTLQIGAGKGKIPVRLPKTHTADKGTETFKAFITSSETDFSWLQQESMRSADVGRSRLRQQFEAAYVGPTMRDAVYEEDDEDEGAWRGIGRSFELRRRPI